MPPKSTRKAIIPVGPSIAYLPLTKGQYALVDTWHVNAFEQYNWHASWESRSYRVASSFRLSPESTFRVSMHRAVVGAHAQYVDHRNGNPLDNRECNLRACTSAENNRNRRKIINKTGFKGVRRDNKSGRYVAQSNAKLLNNGKAINLGTHDTAEEAAKAYDRYAISAFGEFAATNFPRHEYL